MAFPKARNRAPKSSSTCAALNPIGMIDSARDTIAAIATAPGAGGVGIVRLSGPSAKQIAGTVCGRELQPRQAHYVRFLDAQEHVIDDRIALYFAAPASYTGED